MPIQSFKQIAILLTLGSLMLACQEKQQLKEMHDNTEQMNATTSKMAATTDQLLEKTKSVDATTVKVAEVSGKMNEKMTDIVATSQGTLSLMGELYDSGRQGAALDLRMKLWDAIAREQDLGAKVVNAGEYFLAFEFELWSGQGQDQNERSRDLLAKNAAEEFFNHLKIVTNWPANEINVFAQPSSPLKSGDLLAFEETLNEKAIFNSLAVALHKTNRKQEFAADRNSLEVLSMFSIIEKSLKAGLLIRSGEKKIEDYPAYVNEVLKNEKIAIRLLQARYSMLGLVLLGRVTDIGWNLWTGVKLKIFHQGWNLDLNDYNQSQVRFFQAHLTEAQKTKALLQEIKVPVVLDKNLRNIYSKLHIQKIDPVISDQALALDIKDFSQAMKDYLK